MRSNSNKYVFIDNYVEIHTKRGDVILIGRLIKTIKADAPVFLTIKFVRNGVAK